MADIFFRARKLTKSWITRGTSQVAVKRKPAVNFMIVFRRMLVQRPARQVLCQIYADERERRTIAMIYVTKSRTGNYEFRACARARGFPGSTLFGRTHTLRRVCRAITR